MFDSRIADARCIAAGCLPDNIIDYFYMYNTITNIHSR